MKKGLKIFGITCLFLLAAAYFAGSTMMVQQQQSQTVCQKVRIHIVDSVAAQLVLQQDIETFLKSNRLSFVGEKLYQINLNQVEQLITNEQGIKKCEVYTQPNGILTLSIAQRSPLLRLETPRGGYYLDDSGTLFPALPRRTAYVPVVSGNIPMHQPEWMTQLYNFGLYIRGSRFWNAQIEQLHVYDLNNIEIIQRAGTQTTVLMGSLDRFEYKLQKLYTFYRTVAASEGWELYDSIDLRFNDQIVCKKLYHIVF